MTMASMSDHLDKAYEGKSAHELVNAPVDALKGISEGDAELLKKAFGIDTIGDLGKNVYFLRAQEIVSKAGTTKR
jgi:hypothetical protein